MTRRTAEWIARKVSEYSQAVGQTDVLNEALTYDAWHKVAERKSRPLIHYVRTRLSDMAANQDLRSRGW
jgi:hypothetical protein